MSRNDHDHRGEYAGERHDHDGDYTPLHHRRYDLEREAERLQGGLREAMAQADMLRRESAEQVRQASGRIRELEDELRGQLAGVLAQIRVLDRLRPTCVIC